MTKLGLMAAGLLAIPAIVSAGDVQRVQSASDVAGTMDALEAAVTGAVPRYSLGLIMPVGRRKSGRSWHLRSC